jgi:hypothetical protein
MTQEKELPKTIEDALVRLENAAADPFFRHGPNGEPPAPDCEKEYDAARRNLIALILAYGE